MPQAARGATLRLDYQVFRQVVITADNTNSTRDELVAKVVPVYALVYMKTACNASSSLISQFHVKNGFELKL